MEKNEQVSKGYKPNRKTHDFGYKPHKRGYQPNSPSQEIPKPKNMKTGLENLESK